MAQEPASYSPSGYEKRDVNIRLIVLVTVVCVAVIVASLFWIKSFFTRVTEETVYQMVLKPGSLTLKELRAHEDQALSTYQIIDRSKGIYQIPIDSAMAILARERARGPVSR
ncbi:hypothetical protein C3F09_04960 [candidate division GN15 bacterium]|uniref:Uncharacterized protein n=1 Tax=candidate division GN15 bacterium TaxID=2072418 RepID=A0A855X7F6_9BACT|nr:MAG: hypothetical protein C3F09_04960 [candidate division GN15 bacterium]